MGSYLVHKLLIEVAASLDPKYQALLSDFEVVRGVDINFRFRIRNIGKTTFHGGKLAPIIFEKPLALSLMTSVYTPKQAKIPTLKPKQEYIIEAEAYFVLSGVQMIKMKIRSNDESEIKYYQTEKGLPMRNEWSTVMNVLEREKLEQILLLKRLLENKEVKK